MIDLEVVSYGKHYKLYVSQIKIFYTDNYDIRYRIIQTFKNYFTKEKDSEYAIEMDYKSKIYTDGDPLNVNDFEFFEISNEFDLKTDLKLGAKSLLWKYLELKTENLEYTEEYQTLQYLLKDVEEYLENLMEEDLKKDTFHLTFHLDLEKKQLIKLLVPVLIKNEFEANSTDISFDEKIQLQMNLIRYMIKKTKKKSIIIVDLPAINYELIEQFQDLPFAFVIIFSNIKYEKIDCKNYYLCTKKYELDLNDDNAVYDLLMDASNNYTLEEYRTYLVSKLPTL